MDFETYALLKNHIDKLSFNEKAEVPSTQQDKGKVVTVNSEGDKILEYPSAISYKYAYKMQETKSAVLFCVNVGETEPCTYFIPGETKITTLRIYKNGEAVEGSQLATQTPYDKFRVVECNETRVYLILSNSNSCIDSYFYYFSKGKWEIKVEQYPLTELENMFIGFDNEKEFTPESDYQPATKKYVDDEFSNVVLITEQSLTDEQKTQIRKNLSYYDWKTFSDTYGTYTYAIENDSVNYEIAQTIKNTSNNGDISALEYIVSFCYLIAKSFAKEAPNTSLFNGIIPNYNVLVDGGAINHNFFKIIYGDEKKRC